MNNTLVDRDEPISYRAAVIWMVVSLAFLIGFCYKMGMSLWVIATFFGLVLRTGDRDYADACGTRFTRPRPALCRARQDDVFRLRRKAARRK